MGMSETTGYHRNGGLEEPPAAYIRVLKDSSVPGPSLCDSPPSFQSS
jgi:hypothetical protein